MQKVDASDVLIRISFILLAGGNVLVFSKFGIMFGIITILVCAGITCFIAGMSSVITDTIKKNTNRS
jgi:hypothetical protein